MTLSAEHYGPDVLALTLWPERSGQNEKRGQVDLDTSLQAEAGEERLSNKELVTEGDKGNRSMKRQPCGEPNLDRARPCGPSILEGSFLDVTVKPGGPGRDSGTKAPSP